ncbi:DUF3549 family protein [Alteromonas flava]|uniref:DUF3549 family protein n=1 Tax=Alteromonas flava TaxID=2048003 RepID=UPI0013D8F9D7|nr:DUF3549 family protein [Alteromonas flava]
MPKIYSLREVKLSKSINSISEFLLHAGTDYRVFDMGRGIRTLDSQDFLDIENAQRPAPYPRQQHFWVGITYWNQQLSEQQYIWFLKLPLDEQGRVVDAARKHFLELIITALTKEKSDPQQTLDATSKVHDNPYIFTPNQQVLADFNALSRRASGLHKGKDFEPAKQYLNAPQVIDWETITVQGIADCAHFCDTDEWLIWLDNLPNKYPEMVQKHLLCALENRAIDATLAKSIFALMNQQQADSEFALWCLRALTQTTEHDLRAQAVDRLLALPEQTQDRLIVIAGRHWQTLLDSRLMQFLEHTAKLSPEPPFFVSLFADLAQLPDIRAQVLNAIRNPNRSAQLSNAIGWLFQQKPAT